MKERAQDASVTLESSELTRRVLLILTAPQLRGGLTRSASTAPPSGVLEVVNLNERDAGNVVLAADDSGVIAREERQKDGRFAIIGRSQPGIDQRLFLRRTPIVVFGQQGAISIVDRQRGISQSAGMRRYSWSATDWGGASNGRPVREWRRSFSTTIGSRLQNGMDGRKIIFRLGISMGPERTRF